MGWTVRCPHSPGQGRGVIFTPTTIAGAWLIDLERNKDERGFFARSFCKNDFDRRGLHSEFRQCSVSFNSRAGTLRGLHYQAPPHGEIKIVRVTRGAIYDVIVDIRPHSHSYRSWFGVELTADNYRQLYIPECVAHGFQSLVDGSEVYYQISTEYVPEAARGIRWNDPAFSIQWPAADGTILSPRDRQYPDFIE
jgi:dTDP-4-dehydrorhamnose 3,5-epimerase